MQTDITIRAGTTGSGGAQTAPTYTAVRSNDVVVNQQRQETTDRASSPKQLEAAVKEVSSALQSVQRNLNFTIDEVSGRTVVKVIDSSSDEVIRQFPSEEVLALARRMKELDDRELSGLLLQSKA